jgi:hypothetical protein
MLGSVIGVSGHSRGLDDEEPGEPRIAVCAECGSSSGLRWYGWGAYRIDEPETGEPPRLAFYCPACQEREFGRAIWRRFR